MKKILIISLSLLLFSGNINAQKNVIIAVGPEILTYHGDGFLRYPKRAIKDPVRKGPSETFVLRSREKGFEVGFEHFNFNLTELAKMRPVNRQDRRMYEYGSVYGNDFMHYEKNLLAIYHAGELLEMSKEEIWAWAADLRRKMLFGEIRLYIEDWAFRVMEETGYFTPQYYEVRVLWDNAPAQERPDQEISEEEMERYRRSTREEMEKMELPGPIHP